MRRMARLATLLVVATMAVGCGSDDDEASTPTTGSPAVTAAGAAAPGPETPPCELLSREEVAQILGNPVAAGVPAGKDCFWGTDVDGGTGLNLTVDKPAAAQASTTCEFRKASISKENREQVGGVGTSAVWTVQELSVLTQGNLVACYDDAVVWVIVTGEKEPGELRSTASDIAEKVHDRL
jgi:hypothetical protein